jgi:dTDP-4-dehydrorhamnose 3,5-epimerase
VIFAETPLAGAYVVDIERLTDERGFFARSFCEGEFSARGLAAHYVQCNISFNVRSGTVRGLHFQHAPHAEARLVRCTAGALFDVIVDLRAESPTYRQHYATELTASNRRMLFVPAGFAHGFQTLADDTEVFYQMSAPYAPGHAAGVRYDDPALAIDWPLAVAEISQRDLNLPCLG